MKSGFHYRPHTFCQWKIFYLNDIFRPNWSIFEKVNAIYICSLYFCSWNLWFGLGVQVPLAAVVDKFYGGNLSQVVVLYWAYKQRDKKCWKYSDNIQVAQQRNEVSIFLFSPHTLFAFKSISTMHQHNFPFEVHASNEANIFLLTEGHKTLCATELLCTATFHPLI